MTVPVGIHHHVDMCSQVQELEEKDGVLKTLLGEYV